MGCFGSKDKLSKEDMDFLKSHTRYDEATIKEWYKGFKQDCPNGRLTPAKFVDMYKMFFPSGNAEEFCDHVFRTFDMDKNGYIDFKEDELPLCDRSRLPIWNDTSYQCHNGKLMFEPQAEWEVDPGHGEITVKHGEGRIMAEALRRNDSS
ncbi:hypothetical protein KM043_015306 [Ampulex compressa]|nr:hypothetical protein KM043_015306 [Ampulex compressa]